MSVCQRCILPDSYPGVSLDGEGICNLCRLHEQSPRLQRPAAGKEALLQVLTSKPRPAYDCVVPLSGGKDSSYALYFVARQLGLRPLAVFADSGFVVEAAKQNIRSICQALGVDLVVHEARFRRRIAREALHIWKLTGAYFSACPPCETNNRSVVIREATKRGIPFMLWGASDYEDDDLTFFDPATPTTRERYARKVGFSKMTLRQKARHAFRVTGLGIVKDALTSRAPWHRRVRASAHALKYLYYTVRNNMDVNVPEGWRKYLPLVQTSFAGKGAETIYIFDYLPYDPRSFVATLKEEVGWRAADERETRLDCKLHALWATQSLKETGFTLDGFTFSVLVRYGLMSRAEAARKETVLEDALPKECERLLQELGVDREGILC